MTTGTVFLATIVLSAPEFGIAVVVSAAGSADTKHMFIAHLPLNDAMSGAIQQANFVEGTAVVCLLDETMPNKAYILAPANYALGDIENTLYGRANYNIESFTESQSSVFTTALESILQGQTIDFQNFSHGADINVLPGDTDIVDQNGAAGLHIGRTVAQLKGSPAAFIDVSNITNAIRQVADKSEQHLPLSVVLAGKELIVHDIAVTEAESFGLKDGNPLEVKDNDIEVADKNALPLYRMQTVEGAAVDGKEELVVGFPASNKHYCNTEPPVLAKKRTSLSGAISEASADGLISVKSPAIEAIHQVNYNKNRSPQEQEDILQPWAYPDYYEEEQKEVDPSDAISDAAINKLIDKLFTGDYLEKLKQKMAEHGLQVSTNDGLLVNQIKGNFKTGPTTKQQYGIPDSIKLTDPVTGKETTYFATSSFISQEPDGSILICDGYGSEIRMSRGNIYISPALDLFFRPGRDLSSMAPRHQSFNAQADTTINSSQSIYVRAVGSLKMAGATGGSGIVSLENDSTVVTGSDNGLLLKSKCGATLVGADLYLGINTTNDITKANVSEPTRPGTIIIDACSNGVIDMRCKSQMLDTNTLCAVASTGAVGSALFINPGMVGIYSRGLELTADCRMVGKKDAQTITVVRDGAEQQITLYGRSSPSLAIGGTLLVDTYITCNGGARFCSSITANGVGSTSQFCGVVERTQYNDPFKKEDIEKLDTYEIGNNISDAILAVSNSIYQDWFINMKAFSFPVTYNVDPELRVPGMMWQVNTSNIGGYKVWQEKAITTADGTVTMCYPGASIWNSATISLAGYTTTNLNTGYITNTLKENNL